MFTFLDDLKVKTKTKIIISFFLDHSKKKIYFSTNSFF